MQHVCFKMSENTTKRSMNKTFKHYPVCEHFCLSQVRWIFIKQWWMFNNEDNNSHDPALLNVFILTFWAETTYCAFKTINMG